MKKITVFLFVLALSLSSLFAQVLASSSVKNTLSTSFGSPHSKVNSLNPSDDGVHYYGLLETLQVHLDIGPFTAEGMLNWGALTNWDVNGDFNNITFANTEITPFYYTNWSSQGGWWTNPFIESYYVNFLFHPIKGLDFGMGTRLNWVIGPAPSSHDDYWGATAHIVQGGLKDAAPGNADVSGYTYYANCYTALYELNTKAALGIRYRYEDMIEVGITLPSGVTTNAPVFNAAFAIQIVKQFRASLAYEGILRSNGNLYTGLSINFDYVILDAYLAINFRNNRFLADANTEHWGDHWGTGAAITFNVPKINMSLRPEVGFSFFNNANYTMAWYTGARMDFAFASQFVFGAWSSYAVGSSDNRWYDKNYEGTYYHPEYVGGHVFDIRPDLTWNINSANALTVYLDFQNRLRFNNKNWNTWASGLYWTYSK